VNEAAHSLYADDTYWSVETVYEDRGAPPAVATTTRVSTLIYSRMIQGEGRRRCVLNPCSGSAGAADAACRIPLAGA
jgi:hypothetical protein